MTRTLDGLVDAGALVRELRAEQLLAEPVDLRPPPVALRAVETSLLGDALRGRVSPEAFAAVDAADFVTNGYGAIWTYLAGASSAGVLPSPDDVADGLAAHLGVDRDAVLAVIERIALGAVVVVPSVTERAAQVREVARMRRFFAAVERLDAESRCDVHARGELDVERVRAELRAVVREVWK